jgi:hypothetical protein
MSREDAEKTSVSRCQLDPFVIKQAQGNSMSKEKSGENLSLSSNNAG